MNGSWSLEGKEMNGMVFSCLFAGKRICCIARLSDEDTRCMSCEYYMLFLSIVFRGMWWGSWREWRMAIECMVWT